MPSFVAAGALAGNATLPTQAIVAPACSYDDILIAQVINKAIGGNTMQPPDASWSQLAQDDCDCTTAADDHRFAIFWKRADTEDSGASFSFTKTTDDNVLFAGVISAWRGCDPFCPFDPTPVGITKTIGANDNVAFPAFDPARADAAPNQPHVVYLAFYGNDLTTFAAAMVANTNPTCTNRYDLETATGNDCTLACTSGDSDGSAISSRTWASVSTTDSGSTGVVFALVPPNPVSGDIVAVGGAFAPMGGF